MWPVLFWLGPIAVPSYFALICAACVIGLFWVRLRAKIFGLNQTQALDLTVMAMIFGFVGGRLFHVIYEYPDYYWSQPWRVLEVWRGGFVFFGGAGAAFIACLILLQRKRLPWGPWADLLAPVIILVYAIGRVGSFLSGASFGLPTDLPWAVVYPPGVEAPPDIPLHPAALYEVAWSLGLVGVLLWAERSRGQWSMLRRPGALFDLMLIFHAAGRIVLEQFRGDYRGPLIAGQTVSSWIASALLLLGATRLLALYLIGQRSPR